MGRGSTSANIAILSTRPFAIMATSCCLLDDFINYSASLKRPPLTPYPLQHKKYKTISSQKVKAEMLKRNVAAKWQPSVFICQSVPGLGGGGKAGPWLCVTHHNHTHSQTWSWFYISLSIIMSQYNHV